MELDLKILQANGEQTIKVDENSAVKYTLLQEPIDLTALKQERERLVAQLEAKKPSDSILIEFGKNSHPYYLKDVYAINTRIAEIDAILEGK